MPGPSQASSDSGAAPSAASQPTVDSSTPADNPRQPACAAATCVPARLQKRTGRQSAVSTAQTTPVLRVQDPSAMTRLPANAAATIPASTTPVPCTCCNQAGSPGKSSPARSSSRFRRTADGSSLT